MAFINGKEVLFTPVGGGTTDIVVPDKSTSERGTPGLVAMYNESSGLTLDKDDRIVVASATAAEISAKQSARKPIVPNTMAYAMMVNSFLGNMANSEEITDDRLPPSIRSVLQLVQNTMNFGVAYLEKGQTFTVKKGMFAMVFPYGGNTLSFWTKDKTKAIDGMGTTIALATPELEDSYTTKGHQRVAMFYLTGTLTNPVKTNQDKWMPGCYFKNDYTGSDGSGIAYVFYMGGAE